MGAFKKYDGSVWQSINPKKLKGIPYTGTLPAVLTGTKAGYLHRYKIYGNTEQTGTPTPENPIVPSECGERTVNLFDESTLQNGYYGNDNSNYNVFVSDVRYRSFTLNLPAGTYTLNITCDVSIKLLRVNNSIDGAVSVSTDDQPYTFTLTGDATIYVTFRNQTATNNYPNLKVMLVEGSTALPYEPYGYKLPLLSGSTPVDIYLGESQTTRQIKKLVLTGEEKIYNVAESTTHQGVYLFVYRFLDIGMNDIINFNLRMNVIPYPQFVSSHFVLKSSEHRANWRDTDENEMSANTISGETSNLYIIFGISGITNSNDFKAYLAQQYANGTPVTVWYVLATEETGTLNEPLRKIGDYADTIDSTQTSAQIPTSADSTTISWAGQGLAPSEFDSIQEWVDIPTYTYTNDEWVADN